MTDGAWEIVGRDVEQLPLDRTVGDAVRALIRRRWKNNAAKQVEQRWDLDPKTARNVVNGHCSERTITKAVQAEGWAFWAALGEELTGQTYDQHLQSIIEETERAKQSFASRRDRVLSLEARASELVAMGHRLAAE